jgi:nicotinate-nucleotide adenylyltransferase
MKVKKRIGILGGSFDPPTLAHEKVGEIFEQELQLDEVRYVVARQNPLKTNKANAVPHHRLKMLQLMIQNHDKFSVSDVETQPEFTQGDYGALVESDEVPSYTYDTLKIFEMCEPDSEFIFLGGSDILINFYKWHKAERFIKEFKLAIAIRPPQNRISTISPIKEIDRKNITIVERETMPDISSTDVRTYFSTGDQDKARKLMRPDIYEYVLEHNLYSSKSTY